jgi:hypothetical protein
MSSNPSDFEIVPPDRAGRLALGMSRSLVRKMIGEPFRASTEDISLLERDDFLEAGVVARYAPPGGDSLIEVEFGSPARVTLQGVVLIERNWNELRDELETMGFVFRECADSSIKRCSAAHLSLWVPVDDVESVSLSPREPRFDAT